MHDQTIDMLCRIAKGIAAQFGKDCEVVVHDLLVENHDSTIVAIENGHVSGRKIGDGPSNVVLRALKEGPTNIKDELAYLTRTEDGKVLKSTSIFIKNEEGVPEALLAINYDTSLFMALKNSIESFTALSSEDKAGQTEVIPQNVGELLDELIDQSVDLVGKPVAIMTKEDKIKAIRFLNESGAFLITKAGQKICSHFGISKYTLYAYLDESKSQDKK